MIYLDACRGLNHIGRLGENEHRTILFWESAEIFSIYPGASVTVLHKRPGDAAAYPVAPGYVDVQDGIVCWTIQSGDLAHKGRGKVELVYTSGGVVAKQQIYDTMIDDALDGAGTPPEPWESWIEEVVAAGTHAPIIRNGTWWAWDLASEQYIDTETIAGIASVALNPDYTLTITFTDGSTYTTGSIRGAQGAQGVPGQDGSDYVITDADYAAIAGIVMQDAGFDQKVQAAETAANLARNWADGKNIDGSVSPQHSGNNAAKKAQEAAASAESANESKIAAQAAAVHEPIIGVNGNWWTWDQTTGQYVDSGTNASVSIDDTAGAGDTNKVWSADKLVSELEDKAPIIMDTASGTVASFTDGANNLPIEHLIVDIQAVQSGTGDPAPDNIRSISGWTGVSVVRCGKNLFNASTVVRRDGYLINDNGEEISSGSSGYTENYISVRPNTKYTLSGTIVKASEAARLYYYDNSKDWIERTGTFTVSAMPYTFTTPSNCYYMRIQYNEVTVDFSTIQIESGKTATAYEPYSGTTLPISWQSTAGTIYGGSLDVVTGVLTVTWSSFNLSGAWSVANNGSIYYFVGSGKLPRDSWQTKEVTSRNLYPPHLITDRFKTSSGNNIHSGISGDNAIGVDWPYTLRIRCDTYNHDADAFATAMNGVQVCYELETPVTYQLTPTEVRSLLGENNIFADCGDVSVTYRADTELFVRKHATQDSPVQDVRVKNNSVLNNGIANIPVATADTLGVFKVSTGLQISSVGSLYVDKATSANVKSGENQYKPIVPYNQHESIFYGLTKAAGVDMSSSSNAVGTYTDAAKVAIQKMLGIYEAPWELINEETFTNATEANHEITVDSNGQSFELTDVAMMFELPQVESDASKTSSGQIWYYLGALQANFLSLQSGNFSRTANGEPKAIYHIIENRGSIWFTRSTGPITNTGIAAVNMRFVSTNNYNCGIYEPNVYQNTVTKIVIPKVTGTAHYKLWGKRKWTT